MLLRKSVEEKCIDMALNQDAAVHFEQRHVGLSGDGGLGVLPSGDADGRSGAESECQALGLGAAARTPGALQVVGRLRWHVVHHHLADAADIHAHFHCGGAGKNVQATFVEIFFALRQYWAVDLCRMFARQVDVGLQECALQPVIIETGLLVLLKILFEPSADGLVVFTLCQRRAERCLKGAEWGLLFALFFHFLRGDAEAFYVSRRQSSGKVRAVAAEHGVEQHFVDGTEITLGRNADSYIVSQEIEGVAVLFIAT